MASSCAEALGRRAREHRRGRAAIRLAAVALLGLVTLIACGGDGDGDDDDSAPAAQLDTDGEDADDPGSRPGALTVGECVALVEHAEPVDEGRAEQVVPCKEPHQFEVVGVVDSAAPAGTPYPAIATDASSSELQRRLLEACVDRFESYAGRTPEQAGVVVLTRLPEEQAWIGGVRAVRCIATMGLGAAPGGGEPEMEGSLRR